MIRSIADRTRALIGESIPEGGDAADTMFTDDDISDFLEQGNQDPFQAAYWGWMEKSANYARMVNVNEGNAARELGELMGHALRMADRYVGYVPTPSRGRARMGRIVRETS